MPPVFDAYTKLLHPMLEDLSITDRTLTWDEAEDADEVEEYPPLANLISKSTLVRGSPHREFRGRRILWRTLASRLGVEFTSGITAETFTRGFSTPSWPRYLVGPDEGSLDLATCQELVRMLGRDVDGQTCYFLFDLLKTEGFVSDMLWVGGLPDLSATLDMAEVVETPSWFWPADRSWLACTDHDLTFTIIGGSRGLVDSLLASDVLECIEIQATSRIDDESDLTNA